MAKRKRRYFSPAEKVTILRRHLVDQEPVSELCDRYGLHPRVRLHSAIGYVTPQDKLRGRAEVIWAQRDRKLDEGRQRRKAQRRRQRLKCPQG